MEVFTQLVFRTAFFLWFSLHLISVYSYRAKTIPRFFYIMDMHTVHTFAFPHSAQHIECFGGIGNFFSLPQNWTSKSSFCATPTTLPRILRSQQPLLSPCLNSDMPVLLRSLFRPSAFLVGVGVRGGSWAPGNGSIDETSAVERCRKTYIQMYSYLHSIHSNNRDCIAAITYRSLVN